MELLWQNSTSNKKNFIKTDTFPLFTMHRVAGRPFNIPLMYNFQKKITSLKHDFGNCKVNDGKRRMCHYFNNKWFDLRSYETFVQ